MNNSCLRILMIGAHPDDCEIKTAGVALKYRALGHHVKFVSVTNGETGHHIHNPATIARIRAEEMRKACEIAGIENLVMDNRSNALEADVPTRNQIIKLIREYQPDLIFTHRLNDYHPDHRRTAMLVQDSSYAIRIPNVCPSVPYLTYAPVIVYMYDNFQKPTELSPEVVVGIDDVMDAKVRMIGCHASQIFEWLPWIDGYASEVPQDEDARLEWFNQRQRARDGQTANKYRAQLIAKYGEKIGEVISCAEAFEISEYGGKLTEENAALLFPF